MTGHIHIPDQSGLATLNGISVVMDTRSQHHPDHDHQAALGNHERW